MMEPVIRGKVTVSQEIEGKTNASIIHEKPELEDLVVSPSTKQQSLKSEKYGYNNVTVEAVTSDIDENIKPENIIEGVDILGVRGTFEGVDSSDATATSGDILKDKTAYVNNEKVTGTIEKYDGTYTGNAEDFDPQSIEINPSEELQNKEGLFYEVIVNPIQTEEKNVNLDFSSKDTAEITSTPGVYMKKVTVNKDTNLLPENIKEGIDICGVVGNVPSTEDATATVEDILKGKTAYANGEKITGVVEDYDGSYTGNTEEFNPQRITIMPNTEKQVKEGIFSEVTVEGDVDLLPENIRQGTEIFGVQGSIVGTEDATATEADIISGKTAYVNNKKIVGTLEDKGYNINFKVDSNVTDFTVSSCITTIDFSDNNITNIKKFSNAFLNCSKLDTIIGLDTSNVTDMDYMFSGCTSLTSIPGLNTSKVTNMNYMFQNCTSLITIPKFDTGNVINMGDMFSYCTSLEAIPEMNTENVTNMAAMFSKCSNLKTIPLLNTKKAGSFVFMFDGCASLTEIPLIDTSSAISMAGMFRDCSSLIAIPTLNTSKVTNMFDMFRNCISLISIPELDTSNATSMGTMFANCTNLTTVPAFNARSVGYSNMTGMFSRCNSLSNESLNNILKTCISATGLGTSYRKLKTIGLSADQAEICKTLPNYQAFLDAGWTTGY